MKKQSLNQSGIGHLILLMVVVVLVVIGFAGWRVAQQSKHKTGPVNDSAKTTSNSSDLANGKCSGSGTVALTSAPIKAADIGVILPYGGIFQGGHVTPVDHEYYFQKNANAPANSYNVYAPGDGEISDIQHRTQNVGDQNASGNSAPVNQYRIVISHTCTFLSYYDLLTSLDSGIKVGAHVKAGQLVGKIGGESLDFAVWDTTKNLAGLAVPKAYAGESWKIHTVAPLDHFSDSVKKEILPFYERTMQPRDGKLDYDVAGKAIGNWFLKGSGGYSGQPGGQPSPTYYRGHLSIVPDYLDPITIVYSTGDYQGQALSFGVKGNTPNPATIGISGTPTKYELVNTSYVTSSGAGWTGMTAVPVTVRQGNDIKATALIQLIDGNTLRQEIFPGKTAAQVNGFDSAAKTYTRSGL